MLFVIIGNDVWIGGGVIVLLGVIIGDGVVVGVGVVVMKDVEFMVVVVGNFVKVVCRDVKGSWGSVVLCYKNVWSWVEFEVDV